jgi:hypothetical protein
VCGICERKSSRERVQSVTLHGDVAAAALSGTALSRCLFPQQRGGSNCYGHMLT